MKLMLSILSIVFCASSLFAQEELKDMDTILDYKERFYTTGKLNTDSQYSQLTNFSQGDSLTKKVKSGLWIEYFDRKFDEVSEAKYRYYRLVEYDAGEQVGKIYYFKKKWQALSFRSELSKN